eukprot:COSAG01_NODE_3713_length_5770_cov_71.034568_2_plen_184_part_00
MRCWSTHTSNSSERCASQSTLALAPTASAPCRAAAGRATRCRFDRCTAAPLMTAVPGWSCMRSAGRIVALSQPDRGTGAPPALPHPRCPTHAAPPAQPHPRSRAHPAAQPPSAAASCLSAWARFGRSALQTLNCCLQRSSCAPRGYCLLCHAQICGHLKPAGQLCAKKQGGSMRRSILLVEIG